LIAEWRGRYRRVPIIFVAESLPAEAILLALRHRVWNVFSKPVTHADIIQYIRRCFDATNSDREDFAWGRTCSDAPQAVRRHVRKTMPAVDLVCVQYADEITLDQAASCCGLSSFHFSRLFKRENGENFRDYLQRYRIDRAKELILLGCVSVTEACFAVGFNDASHFSRRFKLHEGVAPAEFLRRVARRGVA